MEMIIVRDKRPRGRFPITLIMPDRTDDQRAARSGKEDISNLITIVINTTFIITLLV